MIKPEEFVHLHCHTEYSMLDGVAQIKSLVNAVRNNGQKAVAITDHGVLHGAYYLWDECTKKGKLPASEIDVKPIIGVEAYMTPGTSRFDKSRVYFGGPYGDSYEDNIRRRKDVSGRGAYTHMTMWASDNDALQNLNNMQSIASNDRAFGKEARIDRDLLQTYSKGLIGSTGCVSGAVATYIRLDMMQEALREAGELQDIFGKDNFYIELMDHNTDFEEEVNKGLLQVAKTINAPLVATNDLHYVGKNDAISHDAMLCINSASNLNDENRFKFDGEGYYVKSTQEMFDKFKEIPEALTNTVEIAERCNVSYFPEEGRFMPHVPIPANTDADLAGQVREAITIGEKAREEKAKVTGKKYQNRYEKGIPEEVIDEGAYFISQVMDGMKKRFPDGAPEEYQAQVKFEIDTILDMGFPSYFLVVSDLVRWAKENDVFVGPGRGSAAGSLVAYALEITDLDPIEHKLVFERFLNPERVSLPDIDIDFEEGGRERVIQYCAEKYGDDSVAQIVTFSKIMAKNALRDAARISGFDYQTGDILSKTFPADDAKTVRELSEKYQKGETLTEPEAAFFALYNDPERGKNFEEAVNIATKIEGLTRGWGVHASGVLISDKKISDVCPTMRRDPGGDDDAIITQFEAHGCEDLGFVKMDFLGLKNLNTNKAALKNIVQAGKEPVDLLKIPLDDPKTFEMISNAETLGVFQIDGDGMRDLLKRMKPTSFNDISATIALYRPGPMGMNSHNEYADRKNGRKKIAPIHPEVDEALKDILGDTYGLVVYQEQIQFAARKLAGYSLGEADILRRAMGKKIREELDAQYARFEAGMTKNEYSKDAVKAVWDVFEPFADYAFNRAHSACYGYNAYTNAYLKANYPLEYMAALLTTWENTHAKLAIYLQECARMDITVEVPDVNKSMVDFAPVDGKILFGMGAIRNVGEGTAEEIIKAREAKGEFESFNDFLDKVPESVLNKRKIESLIKAGAFDKFEGNRRSLIAIHSEAIDQALSVKRKESTGQYDLFEALGGASANALEAQRVNIPSLPEFPNKDKLEFEKEMLGRYVSDHPLSPYSKVLMEKSNITIAQLQSGITSESDEVQGEGKSADLADEAPTKDAKKKKSKSDQSKSFVLAGIINKVEKRTSKTGRPWAQIEFEDPTGSETIAMFVSRDWQKKESDDAAQSRFSANLNKLQPGQIVQLKINARQEDEQVRISITDVAELNVAPNGEVKEVEIKLTNLQCNPEVVGKIRKIINEYPGEQRVFLNVALDAKQNKVYSVGEDYKVNPTVDFWAEIREITG